MGIKAQTQTTLTSDILHNRNCYAYFLQLKRVINQEMTDRLPVFAKLQSIMNEAYKENYPYGDLYSSCIASLEQFIDNNQSEQVNIFDNLVQAIYHNDNHILEKSAEWINAITAKARPQKPTEHTIKQKIKDTNCNINHQSPKDTGSFFKQVHFLFADTFKPQHETNLPSIKNYRYKKNRLDPIEYRFSTQAQRHEGHIRISPLFKRWLQINAKKNDAEHPISHIYFNNLALHRKKWNIEGFQEKKLTLELHKIEKNPDLNTLVITLPAHEGLMDSHHYKINTDRLPVQSVFNEFLNIAKENQHANGIFDFKMSRKARKNIFGTFKNQEHLLKELLNKSFKLQGVEKNNFISTAQKQAIWVHFIKYELTKHIIDTVQPNSFNFSCKDAIDRGALSSSYYNLMRSFEVNHPITRKEFERSIDAAAANVKGRGMNFHRKIIWNALNVYINANYSTLLTDSKKSWLIYWRDMHCPHSRAEELLKIRLEQALQESSNLAKNKQTLSITKIWIELLHTIHLLNEQKVHGKRLLLEVISRTSEAIHSSSKKSRTEYKNLANELQIHYPALYILGGLMELLLGAILYLASLGYFQTLVNHGLTTASTGFFVNNRKRTSDKLLEFYSELQNH